MSTDSNQLPRTIVEYQILFGRQETGVLRVEKNNNQIENSTFSRYS